MNRPGFIIAVAASTMLAAPAFAATPREILTNAAFTTRDKAAAVAQVRQAEAAAAAVLARAPNDREATLTRAMAIGYRAKLTRNRGDALAARKLFDAYAAANPRDPEAAAVVGGWHVDAVGELGGLVAGAALGAKKQTGLAALDRSVALGGNRAMFLGLAGLLRLSLDGDDARGRALTASATRGTSTTPLDRIMQRNAAAVLRAGNAKAMRTMAKRLLPFGQVQ